MQNREKESKSEPKKKEEEKEKEKKERRAFAKAKKKSYYRRLTRTDLKPARSAYLPFRPSLFSFFFCSLFSALRCSRQLQLCIL